MLKHLPNALTLLRLILAPVIAWLIWQAIDPQNQLPRRYSTAENLIQDTANYAAAAAILFVVAALTDLFDGIAARAFNAHSKFGRLIDPIADKMLVGLPLIVIAIGFWLKGSSESFLIILSVAVIVVRDVSMTLIRLASPDGEGAPVSQLAKLKTALELVVVGAALAFAAINPQIWLQTNFEPPDAWRIIANMFPALWTTLLVIAAALSAYTAWQYLRPRKKADPQT